ncbi:MAG: hypothetical protein JNK85_00900 [Verrucomicrobiales bacterium]|nr:hypothetical protein [Verrucomicrobiales bacterium]
MKTIAQWVLRIADSDRTWFGFGWLRPAKERRLGPIYILGSSLLLGLPGMALGSGVIHLVLGRIDGVVWLWLVALVLFTELALHVVVAVLWNQRAQVLNQDLQPPESVPDSNPERSGC